MCCRFSNPSFLPYPKVELALFDDAVTGQDIIECDSAVCSTLPCHNNGVCNQVEETFLFYVRKSSFDYLFRIQVVLHGFVIVHQDSLVPSVNVRKSMNQISFSKAFD